VNSSDLQSSRSGQLETWKQHLDLEKLAAAQYALYVRKMYGMGGVFNSSHECLSSQVRVTAGKFGRRTGKHGLKVMSNILHKASVKY
jgi:hypothetical protein